MTHKLIVPLLLCAALSAQAQKPPQKPARRASPPAAAVLPPATPDQIAAAQLAHTGRYDCELGQGLQITQNPRHAGYFDLLFGPQRHTLKPVLSSTGVLRLEDVRGRMLVLQVALKSMLLDVKTGRRLADECVHAQQAENRRAAAELPAAPGLGIDPNKAEAEAAAAAASAAASAPVAPAEATAAPTSGASAAEPVAPPASGAKP